MNIDELKNMSEKELIEHLKKIYERYSIEFDDSQDNLNKVLRELQNQNNNVINDFRNSNYL
jgi:division protein CdvB (Snf7/Vps24/ESCRT-III family)